MFEIILSATSVFIPSVAVIAAGIKKINFFVKALRQGVDLLNKLSESNSEILNKVKNDPNKEELALILSGAIKKIEGLKTDDFSK